MILSEGGELSCGQSRRGDPRLWYLLKTTEVIRENYKQILKMKWELDQVIDDV